MSTIEEARAEKVRQHWAARQERQLAERGPRGLAEAWWDRVRAQCRAAEEKGDPELWNVLARTLENFCAGHSK
ncbi:hypothetical protein ACIGW7_40015 [Streptomyces sp. NPDC053253]|uniref:hypothetical protein n=1 Tax=Streptomyces sp. NPDC053253 TaxID=3365699 RepID=UPI0037D73FDF